MRILRTLSEGEQVTAAEITRRELVPQQFAYKILRKLAKAGFVSIARGADGGCRLTTDLETKTLFDLMVAMDALEPVNACMKPGYQCAWRQSHDKPCVIHSQLELVQEAVNRELRSHTLAAILFGKKKKGEGI